jgi:hypothetical protein
MDAVKSVISSCKNGIVMKFQSKLIRVRSTYRRERFYGGGGLALTPCILHII